MHAVSLYLFPDDPDPDATLESYYNEDDHRKLPALQVETQESLDGRSVCFGTAAGHVETQRVEPIVVTGGEPEPTVTDTREQTTVPVVTDFVVDAGAGYLGVEKSDADFIREHVALAWNVRMPVETRLDIDEFERQFHGDGSAWMTTASEIDDEAVEISYHGDASLHDAGRRQMSGVGFEFDSEVGYVRGVAYKSGYLAVFTDLHDEQFAEFARTHVVPHLERADDDQQFLDEAQADEEAEAE